MSESYKIWKADDEEWDEDSPFDDPIPDDEEEEF